MAKIKKRMAGSVLAGISWAKMYAILEEAFKDKHKAEEFLQALAEAVAEYKEDLATKDDLEIVKLELKRDIAEVQKEIEQIRAELVEKIEKVRSDLLKWMIGLLVPVYLGIVGTLLGIFVF